MYVTIIRSKILYGTSYPELQSYMLNTQRQSSSAAYSREWAELLKDLQPRSVLGPDPDKLVELESGQFIRFKAAGRRHQQRDGEKSFTDPLSGKIYYDRTDRTGERTLQKWDTSEYRNLVRRLSPWGPAGATNRDHLLADSINQARYRMGENPYIAHTAAELKGSGLAVTVSGKHHREGSSTYGGRVQALMQHHALHPELGVNDEIDAMLEHKQKKGPKSHVRIEMVGAYAFLYKSLVKNKVIDPTQEIDAMLLKYLRDAALTDDRHWRIDPGNLRLKMQKKGSRQQLPIHAVPDPLKPARWTTPGL